MIEFELLPILAGMPSVSLSLSGTERINAISFFLAVILFSTLIIKFCWSQLAALFPQIPKGTFLQSLAVSLLFGLGSIIVLTMISGARELMTPGAWEPDGITYRLSSQQEPTSEGNAQPGEDRYQFAERERKISQLRDLLLSYAAEHENRFPQSKEEAGFAEDAWQLPAALGGEYLLFSGRTFENQSVPVVVEPEVGGSQWAILANGSIENFQPEMIHELLAKSAL